MGETRRVKLSLPGLILKLIIDGCLSIILIGIYLFIRDLIRYFTTYLEFNDKHIHGKVGLIRSKELDMPLNKVNGIAIRQGVLGHLLNYGSLLISGTSVEYCYDFIDNPKTVKDELMRRIENY